MTEKQHFIYAPPRSSTAEGLLFENNFDTQGIQTMMTVGLTSSRQWGKAKNKNISMELESF